MSALVQQNNRQSGYLITNRAMSMSGLHLQQPSFRKRESSLTKIPLHPDTVKSLRKNSQTANSKGKNTHAVEVNFS